MCNEHPDILLRSTYAHFKLATSQSDAMSELFNQMWHEKDCELGSKASPPPEAGCQCFWSLSADNAGIALRGGSHPDIKPSNVLERPTVLFHK